MPNFGASERGIKELFYEGITFCYDGNEYAVIECGKPTCRKGEPKTDIYILAEANGQEQEFKISFKQTNADFIENKTNAERAELILGEDWENIIIDATMGIADAFYAKPLIYKKSHKRTGAGSITLGWKYELLNKSGGDLSGVVNLSREQVIDVYAGTHLPADKRNASVNGRFIRDSGIANFMLVNEDVFDAQSVIDNIVSIEEYVDMHPTVYFACKALNYRTFEGKYDGNRPLSVFVDWNVVDGKLDGRLVFDAPLVTKGDEVADKLLVCLDALGIDTTDDIDDNTVTDSSIIIE